MYIALMAIIVAKVAAIVVSWLGVWPYGLVKSSYAWNGGVGSWF